MAFSVVDTSVGKDGGSVGGGGISGVSDAAVEPGVADDTGADSLALGPAGPEPPPEHPATASSKAAGSSALFLIVPPEEWHECHMPTQAAWSQEGDARHPPWCSGYPELPPIRSVFIHSKYFACRNRRN